MNLAWLQRQRELFNSAVLGCCVNYARVLSKQNESVHASSSMDKI